MKLSLNLFAIGILLTPLYFFSSGGIQVADLFFVLSLLIILGNKRNYLLITEIKKVRYFKYLKLLTLWCFIVNIFYFIIWQDFYTLSASIFYFYNFSLTVLAFTLYQYHGGSFLRITYYALILSVIIVTYLGIFNFDYLFADKYYYRRAVSFNNPNQLGYWSLLVLALILLVYKSIDFNVRFKNILVWLAIPMSFYLSMISLSKAASVSIILLILLFTFNKVKIVIPILIIFSSLFYMIEFEEYNFISKYTKRLTSIGQANDDNLEGRNYDRIWLYPEYLIFGAGEGAIEERFGKDNEIHSTFGTILFSYGIIGFLLFFSFFYRLFKRDKAAFLVLMLPVMAYGITHMGFRFKLFWIFLSLFEIYVSLKKKNNILNG
jgi:hypothetical protein